MFKKYGFIFVQCLLIIAVILFLLGHQEQFEFYAFLALFNYISYSNIERF